jgi:hypothetical protein
MRLTDDVTGGRGVEVTVIAGITSSNATTTASGSGVSSSTDGGTSRGSRTRPCSTEVTASSSATGASTPTTPLMRPSGTGNTTAPRSAAGYW